MKRIAALLLILCSCGEVEPLRHLPDGGDETDAPVSRTVTVAMAGAGRGIVTGDGLDCGATCAIAVEQGATVTLSATAADGSTFAGWGGACSAASGSTCEVTISADVSITASFALDNSTLFITKTGAGNGSVTSAPAGIDCGATCEHSFNANAMVTLTATPDADSTFSGWSGPCTGTGPCTVTMNTARSVNAAFTHVGRTLDVARSGTGAGTVTSTPIGIDCGSDCSETFEHGTSVTLDAAAAIGSTFTGWSGACTGTGPCTITMTAAKSVTATFAANTYALTVSKVGNGTVSGPGIACGADCTESYAFGTNVTLSATPATGSTFTGWSGACSGTGNCVVTIDAAKSVTATFSSNTYALTVSTVGNGTVTGPGIACGADCSETYAYGTSVTLTATPSSGATFTGWSGACSGTGSCVVTMDAAKSVTATFTSNTYALTVSTVGNGVVAGTGIMCGTDCTESYAFGTSVTLTATPATGASFTGWSGACSGTGSCVVTMDAAKSVTATFTSSTYALTVSTVGNGVVAGTGIMCGTDCTESYAFGTSVTLTATPATGASFTGWSGACSGTGSCVVTMDAGKSVTATFTSNSYALTVTKSGNGTVSGPGIACGTDCTESYAYGTSVTLTATPATGSTFTGWSGACSGTGSCVVTIDAAKSVTATFTTNVYTLTVTTSGNGSVAGTGIMCGTDCTESFAYGTTVTLTPMSATGYNFAGWGGACSGTGSCVVTMDAAKNVTASFVPATYMLTVTTSGNGSVSGTGISCGIDCTEPFSYGSSVTLTATPATGHYFAGWAGDCSGTGTCVVSVDGAKNVTASFVPLTYMLTVSNSGGGLVTGPGIDCGNDCSQPFSYGSPVNLTATPSSGYTFVGWSGDCGGTGSCSITMLGARNVTATFAPTNVTLNVSVAGNGTVVGTGITCGTDCDESLPPGTVVTLNATPSTAPATASRFVGWSGACSGTGTCMFTIGQNSYVTANFVLAPNIIFATSGTFSGNLGGIAGADAICQSTANNAGLAGTYRAYLSSLEGNTYIHASQRFGGASGWVRVDGVPVMNSISQMHSGTLFAAPLLAENGANLGTTQWLYAWTGTNAQGSLDSVCSNPNVFTPWQGTSGTAMVGAIYSTSSTVVAAGAPDCSLPMRLYCLGVDRAATAQ